MKTERLLEQIISIPLYFLLFPAIPAYTQWEMTKESNRAKRLKKSSFVDFKKAVVVLSLVK